MQTYARPYVVPAPLSPRVPRAPSVSDRAPPCALLRVQEMCDIVDSDRDGEISFDEFFVFGRALERHVATSVDPAELIQDMFDIIDEDRGGLITVQELHQTISEIGQELSVDDVRARRPSLVRRSNACDDDTLPLCRAPSGAPG